MKQENKLGYLIWMISQYGNTYPSRIAILRG